MCNLIDINPKLFILIRTCVIVGQYVKDDNVLIFFARLKSKKRRTWKQYVSDKVNNFYIAFETAES